MVIQKSRRLLCAYEGENTLLRCPVALSAASTGHKQREGDGKTPEGVYHICLVKENGKYGQSLGLSYPNAEDAKAALLDGRIDKSTCEAILSRLQAGQRPPWGTALGGEIYIHAGGTQSDWTQGCIALDAADMAKLFALRDNIDRIEILP